MKDDNNAGVATHQYRFPLATPMSTASAWAMKANPINSNRPEASESPRPITPEVSKCQSHRITSMIAHCCMR
jgi:hypothetical protein